MDSDDIAHPERLKLQWDYLQFNPLVGCISSIIFGSGRHRIENIINAMPSNLIDTFNNINLVPL